MKGFEQANDSSILSFVIDCEIVGAINFEEFKEYLYYLIKITDIDEIPMFIWDLLELDFDEKASVYNIIGFVPHSNLTDEEQCAIYGIAIKRFNDVYDMPISKNKALNALESNPHILHRFKETFPFIKLDF